MLIAAAGAIEAPLLARRLASWGAQTRTIADLDAAAAEAMQYWDAILVDRALGLEACRRLAAAAACTVARRIVLITPAERHELPALQAAGFTGYLVKPIRVASLAAQLGGEAQGAAPDGFARADSRDQALTLAPSGIGSADDPGRRGQRDQRAARPRAAGPARPPPHGRAQRRRRARSLGRRPRRRNAV